MNTSGSSGLSTSVVNTSIASWTPAARRTVFSVSFGLLFYSMGLGLAAAAMGNRVNDIGDRAILLGLLGLAEFLPVFGLVFITGSVADRRNRKYTVLLGQGAAVTVMLLLFVNSSGSDRRLWPYFAAAVALGACRSFISPSFRPIIPAAVNNEQLPRAMSFYSGSWQVAFALGPLLFFVYGYAPKWAFLVAAGLGLAGIAATTLIPAEVGRAHLAPDSTGPKPRPSMAEAIQGLTVIRRHPILLGAIALDLAAVLFGGAVALLPRLSKNVLQLSDFEQGVLRSAGGIGAVLVAVVLASKPFNRSIGTILLVAVALFGVFTIVLGLATSLWVACVAHAALLGADSVSVYIRSTLVPLVTPPDQQGRVAAVESVFIGASNELGAAESGVAAELLGTRGGIVSGGVLTLGVVALWWVAFPALRKLDRFSDADRHTPAPTG
jgi:MFS family permease